MEDKLVSPKHVEKLYDKPNGSAVPMDSAEKKFYLLNKVTNKWKDICAERRADRNKNASTYRKGPAPIDNASKKSSSKPTYGTLDSDVDDLDFSDEDVEKIEGEGTALYGRAVARVKISKQGHSLASCRSLILYFSKLGKAKDENENIDLKFLESMLKGGTDVNFADKHGQTIMHEIARAWHPNVLKFIIEHGGDVNQADYYGRTPLHLASAVDYPEMVEFLVKNGANIAAATKGENQTPLHYAAKNNAIASMKKLLNLGARIDDKDYKERTPLFVAAETARAEAAQFLLAKGAPVGVYDSSGTPCLSIMIEKMPQIALEAVEQFHITDRAFRKDYYYLSFLENDPKYLHPEVPKSRKERKEKKYRDQEMKRLMKEKGMKESKQQTFAKIPLEVIIQYGEMDIIMHSVFQRLLKVKWDLFGKKGVAILVSINLIYTLIWTFLGIFNPRDGKYYDPISSNLWRIFLEFVGIMMTIYFLYREIRSLKNTEKAAIKWRQWRTRQIEEDLQHCHPRWPDESKYLQSELKQIRLHRRSYFSEPWNIFEWITYVVILTLIVTRIISVASNNELSTEIHIKMYALGLIVIWLRLMRTCRAFRSLGPFILILGSVIKDTLKFAFLFFEIFIPYVVGFWILFGGEQNGKKMGDAGQDWIKFNDLAFSVWQLTLLMEKDSLMLIDRFMAQLLTGTYFALTSVLCMNLYIALLSDTFTRLYSQSQANAVMQQAQLILSVEKALPEDKKTEFGHYMQNECSPLEVYSTATGATSDDHEGELVQRVVRNVANRIGEMEDTIQQFIVRQIDALKKRGRSSESGEDVNRNSELAVDADSIAQVIESQEQHSIQMFQIHEELGELKSMMSKILQALPSVERDLSAEEFRQGAKERKISDLPLDLPMSRQDVTDQGLPPRPRPRKRKVSRMPVSQQPSVSGSIAYDSDHDITSPSETSSVISHIDSKEPTKFTVTTRPSSESKEPLKYVIKSEPFIEDRGSVISETDEPPVTFHQGRGSKWYLVTENLSAEKRNPSFK